MIRSILYLLAGVFVIALLRGIIGIVTKGVSQFFQEEAASTGPKPSAGTKGFGGELVQCPVCGVFSSPATATKKLVEGKTLQFCSPACADKHAA